MKTDRQHNSYTFILIHDAFASFDSMEPVKQLTTDAQSHARKYFICLGFALQEHACMSCAEGMRGTGSRARTTGVADGNARGPYSK